MHGGGTSYLLCGRDDEIVPASSCWGENACLLSGAGGVRRQKCSNYQETNTTRVYGPFSPNHSHGTFVALFSSILITVSWLLVGDLFIW